MIVKFFWFLVISFMLLFMELLFSSVNIIFPAAFIACFYLGVAYNIHVGLICGLMLAVVSEIIFGRTMTILPLFIILVFFHYAWDKFGDPTSMINHAISGVFLSAIYAGFYIVSQNIYENGWYLSFNKTLILIVLAIVSTAILMPLIIYLLDWLAARMHIRQFMLDSKEFGS